MCRAKHICDDGPFIPKAMESLSTLDKRPDTLLGMVPSFLRKHLKPLADLLWKIGVRNVEKRGIRP